MFVQEVITDIGMKAKYMECEDILEDLKMRAEKRIGEGMSGFVALCYSELDVNRKRAMKVFDKKRERVEGMYLDDAFLREVAILQALNHRHIMADIKAYDSPEYRVISMPFYQAGSLSYRLPTMTLALAQKFFLQFTSAVHHLHIRRIVHWDIKLDNILLTNEDNVILCDFGLAKVITEQEASVSGWNMDPFKCDALALGHTLWSMIFKEERELTGACLHCLSVRKSLPFVFRLIIERLCHHDVRERWSVEELINRRHSYPGLAQYLNQVTWE